MAANIATTERTGLSKLEQYRLRKNDLFQERESWIDQWRDINRHLLPRTGRFLVNDGTQNKGDKRYNNIVDSTATRAHGILSAGLVSGATSPARPWFRLATPDTDLMEFEPVKLWLHKVATLMRDIFNRSNTYRVLPMIYSELGGYGTAATFLLENYDTVIHHYPMTIGEYAISTNPLGEVDTIVREINKTVAQIVAEYVRQPDGSLDWSRCSSTIKNMWDRHTYDKWIPITHIIEPRSVRERDLRSKLARDMPWASCHFESNQTEDRMLRESGYKRFPVLAPRWDVTGGDIYGDCPGMRVLGDLKQLQHQQIRKAQGIDYMVKPPLQAPAALKEQYGSQLPGGVTFHDMSNPNAKITPQWQVNLNLDHLREDIQDVRDRINQGFYADLFMMIANIDRTGVTAREIAEKHEEKLLMLGPVLERLHGELLMKKIDITFDRMLDVGIVPPPPEELNGMDLNVEFVSVLAQAQRAVGIQSADRLIGTIASLAAAKGDLSVWDKVDTDQVTDDYADMLGVPPSWIVGDEKVAIVRQQRAEKQAAAEQAAMMQAGAETAKTASEVDTGSDNMLTDLMNQFQGYSIPT